MNEIDTRPPFFCFSNYKYIQDQFNIDSDSIFSKENPHECVTGSVTIKISDYRVDKLESMVTDMARLDSIISNQMTIAERCK